MMNVKGTTLVGILIFLCWLIIGIQCVPVRCYAESSVSSYPFTINKRTFTADKGNLTMYTGDYLNDAFNLKISKKAKQYVKVVYSSSDIKIARINKSKGYVKGRKAGTVKLTARITYKGKTVKLFTRKLTVKKFKLSSKDCLKGKTIVGLGDSLMYGNILGNDVTWLNRLGKRYKMKVYNYGDNGNPIASVKGNPEVPMCIRYKSIIRNVKNPDIIIVEGGANDRRNNVPLGKNSSTSKCTFKGALNIIIRGLQKAYPNATIICMTNYRRYGTVKNNLGLKDKDYVRAMKEVCKARGILCYDNYYNLNAWTSDKNDRNWMDEGIYLGQSRNGHFSPEGYRYLMSVYDQYLHKVYEN